MDINLNKVKKKVLITGSNGLLGQKLVQLLSEDNNYQVHASGRGANRAPSNDGYEYHPLDITNKSEIDKIIGSIKPDFIIHTAAMTNVDQCEAEKEGCWKQNVDAAQYLSEAAEKNKSFLIHLSTDFIFDGKNGPYDETALAKPLSYYGESKLAAENIVQKSSTKWAIIRTVLVYGLVHDMSRSNIILWVKKNLEESKTINVVNDQFRTPTLAEDLAMGCYLVMKNEATGIFNISGKDMLTPYDMAMKTADFFRLDKKFIVKTDSTKFTQPAVRPMRTGFVIDKAVEKLGYDPHSFEEGIKLLAEQMKERGTL
ncbi:MAG TPA: SDR family oxidoreductase [Cytophagaceae bacterium]|jgi:dTDP-4-dehydrorhamnose reductase|nr:SDR family oxidoreductase [Cytophagaceae bacterium]